MAVLDNPILNTPFAAPAKHWLLDNTGKPTGETVEERRRSEYIVAVATPKRKRGGQEELIFDEETTTERLANDRINAIRAEVDQWRISPEASWGVTYETARLLKHWRATDRERPLFFCQAEAAETMIWLTEVAPRSPVHAKHVEYFRGVSEAANPGLFRLAMKLATGAGKTTVMAMLIAWQAINKARRPQSKTFTDAFLLVAPGITIKDRLRVLMPETTNSIYERLSIVPRDMMDDLKKARIVVTNFHAFQLKVKTEISKGTLEVLRAREDPDAFEARFRETESDMVKRVMAPLMGRRGIIVINDEAHHCYEAPPASASGPVARSEEESQAEADAEAEQARKEARVWINGIRAIDRVIGVKTVYDLSATPFFLRGSGQEEGKLFPWVASDFSLMDAIEAGIVKVPRVPTHDDVVKRDEPIFRHVYKHVRDSLPRKSRRKSKANSPDELPAQLEAALKALYRDYAARYDEWITKGAETPPVFIVVANNTSTSKLIHDWIAGWCENPDEEDITKRRWRAGNLALFNNVEDGKQLNRRRTILIDSHELDSGDAISEAFKEVAADEIEAFRRELRRTPGRDADAMTDADLLREVMNTVGQKGKLGAPVRCVVSVSMLTEGWDANTVTHILGCRAFGTRLLCEQVVGRALRRVSYEPDDHGMFRPEYAEVLGVPFDFMPANSAKDFSPPKPRTRVFADESRAAPEIRFPRVLGYRVQFPKGRLNATFFEDSRMRLGADTPIPKETEIDPLVGAGIKLDLGELDAIRPQTVAYMLAKRALERWALMAENMGGEPLFLFPQFLRVARRWLTECLQLADGRTAGWLSLAGYRDEAVDRIVRACAKALDRAGKEEILPVMQPFEPEGSSRSVDLHTAKTTLLATDPVKCQVNYVVYDSDWEAAFAERLERIPRVRGYVKNHGLGFEVPYLFMGTERSYRPDFIVHWDDGQPDPLQLVVEIKGRREADDEAKADTLRSYWLEAVNNDGRFGRWGPPIEIIRPFDMAQALETIVNAFEAALPATPAMAA
ncbi:restriction endonuclease [Mesorhizobium sp. LSHC414A00]|nr:restriction endonuclease [Mesorhizobium sp. LSHC414A00]